MANSTKPNKVNLDLIQRAVHGDKQAFATLFQQYFQPVYNYALSLCNDTAQAEDITQEAFIRAHANLHRLGPPWNFRTWIFRMTRNLFIDITRKRKDEQPLEEETAIPSAIASPEQKAMVREMADRIRATLQNLSPKNQEALLLREIQGLSYAEIAEVMSITSAYVKTLLHRARTQFQEAYGIRMLLEEPTEDCAEISQLLDTLHDGEPLQDKDRFVKQHLKECKACRERRRWLVTQSGILAALVPVIPPSGLQQRILESTGVSRHLRIIRMQRKIRRMLLRAGAVGLVGVAAWMLFSSFRSSPPSKGNSPPPSRAFETPSSPPNQPAGDDIPATGVMADPSTSVSATSEISSPLPTPSKTPTATNTSVPPTFTSISPPWTPTLTSVPPTWTPTFTSVPPTATATMEALGTISGEVWKDSNADGVRQGSEQSYPGVTIRLGQGACPSSGYMSAISAGDGSYSFLNVPAGTYCLFADLAPTCEIYSIITTPNDLTLDFTTGIEGSGWVIPFGFAPYVC